MCKLAGAAGSEALVDLYADAARKLHAAGAEVLAVRIGPLKSAVEVPSLRIAEAVGLAARGAGFRPVGLLVTRETGPNIDDEMGRDSPAMSLEPMH